MFRSAILSFLVLAFLALALSEESATDIEKRIINGKPVSHIEWAISRPWLAKNVCDYGDGNWVVCGCSSTIIHPHFLITAGHCLNAPYTYKVGLLLSNGKIIDGFEQIKTPNWDYGSTFHKETCGTRGIIQGDVGLQYVKNPIQYGWGVQEFPGFLIRRVVPAKAGDKGVVEGWGASTEQGAEDPYSPIFATQLQKLDETVFSNSDCQGVVANWLYWLGIAQPTIPEGYCSFQFTDELICAGKKPLSDISFSLDPLTFGYPYDPTGICLGDSGSPLLDESGYRILGFVSDTLSTSAQGPCGYGVDIYTKLTQGIVDWVRTQVRGRGHTIVE